MRGLRDCTRFCAEAPRLIITINSYVQCMSDNIINKRKQPRDEASEKKGKPQASFSVERYMTSPQLWPNCCRVFETDTLRATPIAMKLRTSRYSRFFSPFFFYHPLCRPAGIDRGCLWYWILETRNTAETIAPRCAFHFAWISSSKQQEQSTSWSRVIVCCRRLLGSLLEISSPDSPLS